MRLFMYNPVPFESSEIRIQCFLRNCEVWEICIGIVSQGEICDYLDCFQNIHVVICVFRQLTHNNRTIKYKQLDENIELLKQSNLIHRDKERRLAWQGRDLNVDR